MPDCGFAPRLPACGTGGRVDSETVWDIETDILVVGSGAGALTAAVTAADHHARVLVIEKSAQFGGTSATSGGAVWIPASRQAAAAGAADTPEEGFAYIKALTGDAVEDERIWAYVRQGPAMLDFLERATSLKFVAIPYTDYHAELPGGKLGYRTHDCNPIHASALGADFDTLRPTHPSAMLFGVIPWTMYESAPMITQAPGWQKILAKVIWRYVSDVKQRLRGSRSRFLVFGNALMGRLKLALDAKGGKLLLDTGLVSLVRQDGRVVGAVASQNGRKVRIAARRHSGLRWLRAERYVAGGLSAGADQPGLERVAAEQYRRWPGGGAGGRGCHGFAGGSLVGAGDKGRRRAARAAAVL